MDMLVLVMSSSAAFAAGWAVHRLSRRSPRLASADVVSADDGEIDELEARRLQKENWELKIRNAGIQALVTALEARDGYTSNHCQAVVDLARDVGAHMGLDEPELVIVEQVALLHDIGKVGIPDSVLSKNGLLDPEEWQIMLAHPVIGERMVASMESLCHLGVAIRAEHERWDGKGYPDGLAGEDIPLVSRIVFACDAYHAMVSDRPYRAAMDHGQALREITTHAGSQFCPTTVSALQTALSKGQRRRRRILQGA